jgi:hypothetical protein
MFMYIPNINSAVKRWMAAGTHSARSLLRAHDKQA